MSFRARHPKAVMAAPTSLGHLEIRQESPSQSSGTPSATRKQSSSAFKAPPQPTTLIPLTATFTPPKTCFDNRLSMLPPPRYEVWANIPVPVSGLTSTACYPPEFLEAYTSVDISVTGTVTTGSSVVPAMSGFVCPANYCTQILGDDNYAACCPSDYEMQLPATTIDRKRPAYGGTCISELDPAKTYTITKYDTAGDSVLIEIATYTSGDHAYAHPIDGFAASGATPVSGCGAASSSIFQSSSKSHSTSASPSLTSSNSSAAPTTTAEAADSSTVSKGTIAGVSVAAVAGLAGLIFLVWFILRCIRRRKTATDGPSPYNDHELADTGVAVSNTNSDAKLAHHEKEGSVFISEMPAEKYAHGQTGYGQSRVNDGQGPYEIAGDSVPEMDGAMDKKNTSGYMADTKIGFPK